MKCKEIQTAPLRRHLRNLEETGGTPVLHYIAKISH